MGIKAKLLLVALMVGTVSVGAAKDHQTDNHSATYLPANH